MSDRTGDARPSPGRGGSQMQYPDFHTRLFEEHPDGVVLTVEEKIALINPRFEELSGYSVHEIAGRPPTEILTPAQQRAARVRAEELLLAPPESIPPVFLVRKDGVLTPVDVRSRLLDLASQPAILSVVRERPTTAEDKHDADVLLQAIPDMVFRIARDGTYLGFKRGIEATPFLPPEEFLGKKVHEVVPHIAESVMSKIEAALATRSTQLLSFHVEADDGLRSREARFTASGPDDVVVIVRDVTDQKDAEEELRKSEARFSIAFHDNPVPVSISRIDDGTFIDANEAFLDLIGVSREDLIGITSAEIGLLNPDFQEEAAGIMRDHGVVQDVLVQIHKKTGEELHVQQTMRAINVGDEPCLLSTLVDVTEVTRLEAELQATRDELEGRVARQLVRGNPYKLTFREFTVLNLIGQGKADKEIASELHISPFTVHRHVSNILGKMDCSSRTEAGTRALREGLLD